jgi:hypothetical protein
MSFVQARQHAKGFCEQLNVMHFGMGPARQETAKTARCDWIGAETKEGLELHYALV